MYFSEDTLVEQLVVDTDSTLLRTVIIPAHHGVGSSTFEMIDS